MATSTAQFPISSPHGSTMSGDTRPQPRVLWPWPVFLLGIAALAGVWYARPHFRMNPADRVRRDLREMRSLLHRQPTQPDRALAIGRQILILGEPHPFPDLLGETHYLLGVAHQIRAQEAAGSDSAADWKEARAHFEQAELAGVPEDDKVLLAYRLAKAWHFLQVNPELVIQRLQAAEDGEDRAERWQLLAEAHLRMPTPNVRAAIEAVHQQLALLPATAEPRVAAQARYRAAELYLRLNEPQEARRALERIDSDSAGDVYYPSRTLLARCLQKEGNFLQAAKTWEQAKANPKATSADLAMIYYELGHCYAQAQKPAEATSIWKQAQVRGGMYGQAATLRVAELLLEDKPNAAQAIPIFEDGLKGVTRPGDYQNTVYSLKAVQMVLEQATRSLQASGDVGNANRMAELYGRVSAPGRSRELQVEMADALGQKLLAEAPSRGPTEAQLLTIEARAQFRRAGTLAAEAASPERPPEEQAAWLIRAAEFFAKTQESADATNALGVLERVMAIQREAGVVDPKVWFLKAMAHQDLRQVNEALEAYAECCRPGSRYEARARYQLAKLELDNLRTDDNESRNRLAKAAIELEKLLTREVQQSDPELHEHAMFLLGDVVYQQNNHLEAQARLQAAVDLYPQSKLSNNALYLLGRCFWYQAARDSQKLQSPATPKKDFEIIRASYRENLKLALRHFEELEEKLIERQKVLLPQEATLLRQTSFGAAECSFFLEEFEDAVRRYNMLRLRYADRVEELVILSQLWQCHQIYLNQPAKARADWEALRDVLQKLPDSIFDGSSHVHKREFWQNWLQQATPKDS